MDPNEISNSLSQYFNAGLMQSLFKYAGYTLLILLILTAFVVFYFWLRFKYKVTYPILHYDSGNQSAQVLRWKTDRAMTVTKKGQKKQRFLFLKRYTEPFTRDLIKPGNRVNLLRVNDDGTYTPLPSVSFKSSAQFEYLTPFQKKWVMLELEESASANQTPEAAKRILTMVVITGIICLIAIVITVWLAMKAPNQAAEAANTIADSMKGLAQGIGGNAPV